MGSTDDDVIFVKQVDNRPPIEQVYIFEDDASDELVSETEQLESGQVVPQGDIKCEIKKERKIIESLVPKIEVDDESWMSYNEECLHTDTYPTNGGDLICDAEEPVYPGSYYMLSKNLSGIYPENLMEQQMKIGRFKYPEHLSNILQEFYNHNNYLSNNDVQQLCKKTGLTRKRVLGWFNSRRRKEKRENILRFHMVTQDNLEPKTLSSVGEINLTKMPQLNAYSYNNVYPFSPIGSDSSRQIFSDNRQLVNYSNLSNVCDICDKTFSSTSSCKRHRSIHTGEKPFCCNLCGLKFARSYYLKKHKEVRHHLVHSLDCL